MFYLIGTLTLVMLAGAGWVAYGWYRTRALAPVVYEKRVEQGDLNGAVPKDLFEEVYVRAEGPRFSTYLVIAGAFAVIAFPVIVFIFSQLWLELWSLTGGPDWAERGSFVYLTMMVFLYMGFFFAIAWVSMQRFHLNAPPSLRSEIRRLNEAVE